MSAGKGDDYRKVDKKKFDKNYEAIFGKKDIIDFHKEKISNINSKKKSEN